MSSASPSAGTATWPELAERWTLRSRQGTLGRMEAPRFTRSRYRRARPTGSLGVDRRPMFRDPTHQASFARDGFVVAPLVDAAGVQALTTLWDEIRPERVEGIYSNVHDTSPENNRRAANLFKELFERRVTELFVDCHVVGATYLVKGVGEDTESKPHQDWNNVDERSATSVALWCPLVDVDEQNGALQILAGSHRLFDKVRGITTASVYLEFDEELDPFLTPVEVPAGTGVFYAHNVFHGSKPNHTGEIRVAAVSGVLPTEIDHVHYWQPPGGEPGRARVLKIGDEFIYSGLLELYAGTVPDSAVDLGQVACDTTPLTADEVIDALSGER